MALWPYPRAIGLTPTVARHTRTSPQTARSVKDWWPAVAEISADAARGWREATRATRLDRRSGFAVRSDGAVRERLELGRDSTGEVPIAEFGWGTNEHGVLTTVVTFAGTDPGWSVVPAILPADITPEWVRGFYGFTQDPTNPEFNGLLDLPDFPDRADATEPDEAAIHGWLRAHYAHETKLTQPRIEVLLGLRGKYKYLRAPPVSTIYRGLSNVSRARAGKLVGETNPTLDKSWTSSRDVAVTFADGSTIKPGDVDPDAVGVVLMAKSDPEKTLLDSAAIAKIPAVGDYEHPIWGEPLSKSIAEELEVVVLGPVDVSEVLVTPMVPRADVDALAVMLPIPAEIAAQFPAVEGNGEPHVTLVFVGPGGEAEFKEVAKIVREEAAALNGERVSLGPLDHFDGPDNDKRVAYSAVTVGTKVRQVRDAITSRLTEAGIEVTHRTGPWTPHATLAYLDDGAEYDGSIPTGEWSVDCIEVWRGGQRESISCDPTRRDRGIQRNLFGDWSPPAVHTESRRIYEVMRVDKAMLAEPVAQANGWMRYPVLYSRARNVQEYLEGGRKVREYRDPRDVFDPRSMDMGTGLPWELRHSKDLLTRDTVLGVARGATLSMFEHVDGIHTCGDAVAWDRALIHAIESGTARDVSLAFRCKVDPRPGTTDDGEPFDQRQTKIIPNSLASEPRGNAGTARVLTSRADAADGRLVTAASDLRAIALGGALTAPVYFDLSNWAGNTRSDSTMMMNKLIPMLLQAQGMTTADLAAKLSMAETDLAALLAGEGEMTDEQTMSLVQALLPQSKIEETVDAAPGDMAKVMLGDAEYDVPAPVAAHIKALEAKLTETMDRADRASAEAAKRQDAMALMVSRADAETMANAAGIAAGDAMDLARRALGPDWTPAVRKDSAGTKQAITVSDWQRGAIEGAFGDEAPAILARIDAAPSGARDYLIAERIADARIRLDAKAHHGKDQVDAIARARDAAAASSAADRADAGEDDFATIQAKRREINTTVRTAPTGAQA